MVTVVPNFCSIKSVIFAKCTLLILISVANLSATSDSLLSTAQKWFSWRLVMLTKWSMHLLLLMICVSSVEIHAELKVDKIRAAADMPNVTRLRKHLYLVMTLYWGSASRRSLKLLSLSARQEQLILATCSTWVLNGSGHFSMYWWY
jgi:hypothetical protein